jgi:hypothetical protein
MTTDWSVARGNRRRRLLAWGGAVTVAVLGASCTTSPPSSRGASTPRIHRSGPSTSSTTATTASTTTTSTAPPATTTTTVGPPSGIQVGPGPQASYVVEPQPAAGTCHYAYSGPYPLPDPRCTPGAISPAVSQATISSTICASGYTTSVRPPESVTEPEKIASAAAYGYTGSLHTGEYDHLISLELGGDPNDPANLWVEPNDRPGATSTENSKDVLENRLNELVCSGQITLAAAQQIIATNWVAAYQRYG